MKVKISIKNVDTGMVANYKEDWKDNDIFNWTDGNYSCDCNRHLFFERAKGNDPDLNSGKCSNDINKYLVNIQESDGDCNMILKEFEE